MRDCFGKVSSVQIYLPASLMITSGEMNVRCQHWPRGQSPFRIQLTWPAHFRWPGPSLLGSEPRLSIWKHASYVMSWCRVSRMTHLGSPENVMLSSVSRSMVELPLSTDQDTVVAWWEGCVNQIVIALNIDLIFQTCIMFNKIFAFCAFPLPVIIIHRRVLFVRYGQTKVFICSNEF